MNRLFPSRFSVADGVALASAPDDPAVRSARWFHARARTQQAQLGRLRRGLEGVRCTTLPFLFTANVDRADVERLVGVLDRSLL